MELSNGATQVPLRLELQEQEGGGGGGGAGSGAAAAEYRFTYTAPPAPGMYRLQVRGGGGCGGGGMRPWGREEGATASEDHREMLLTARRGVAKSCGCGWLAVGLVHVFVVHT